MKIPCEVIRDLLPLYHDRVCSAESGRMVEEHLKVCEECGKELQMMDAQLDVRPAHTGERKAAAAASEAWRRGKRRAFRKGAAIGAAVLLALLILVSGAVLYVRSQPVDWDAGACGGGYATFVFDKYSEELTAKYVDGSAEKDSIVSARAVRGTQEAEWEDRTIFLQFDIEVERSGQGTVTERVHFVGHRTWIDTYDWSGAIVGDLTAVPG